jgi:hypothetical protein
MTQITILDYVSNQPYPLLLAEKYEFQLDYYDIDGNPSNYLYHAVQWTQGLGASDHTTWERIKERVRSTHNISISQLPYKLDDGRTYQVDYINQETCYHVAMSMRITNTRPQLQEIRDALAKALNIIDEWKREPDKGIRSLAQLKRQKEIDKLERHGYENHSVAIWKREHDETLSAYHDLRERYSQVCLNPHYPKLTNAEYTALFGDVASSIKTMLGDKNIMEKLPPLPKQYLKTAYMALDSVLSTHSILNNDDILRIIQDVVNPLGESLKAVADIKGIHHITGQPLLAD